MLTAVENDIVDQALAIRKRTTLICENAINNMLETIVKNYQEASLDCNFQEIISASIFYLKICASKISHSSISTEMIFSAAAEAEKACRRCLTRIAFEDNDYDLEVEAEESGIRLSMLKMVNTVRALGINKENLLMEKDQIEMDKNAQLVKSKLTAAFNSIVESSLSSIRFIDKKNPELTLLVTSQGLIGYLIGAVSRITKKLPKEFFHNADEVKLIS